MLGLNSGLIGVRRVPTTSSASGIWVPNEQSLAKRATIWPLPPLGSTVFELDAQYYSFGQTFANSCAAPADGSGQTAYDFYRGAGSGSASDDPTFNSAGSASYFSFDGGDFFTLVAGATSTAFLKNLHKSGATFSIEVWFYYPGSDVSQSSFIDSGTSDQGGADMSRGIIYTCTDPAGQQLRVKQSSSGTNALSATATTAFSTGIHMAGLSYAADASSFFYRNGAYDQVSGSNTFTATLTSPSTSDTVNAPRIGVRGDGAGSFVVPNATRIYRIAMYNTALTKGEFDSLWSTHRSRFGL